MKIPKYRVKTIYHGPYVWYVPQVRRWFGWMSLTDKGERIEEQRYLSIEKCRQIIDKHASMLVRLYDYDKYFMSIEPCITWTNGEKE